MSKYEGKKIIFNLNYNETMFRYIIFNYLNEQIYEAMKYENHNNCPHIARGLNVFNILIVIFA